VAPLIVPPIAATLGWHWAFVFAGIAGLIWLGAWLPLYHLPDQARKANDAERAYIRSDPDDLGQAEGQVSWKRLLGFRQTWSFVIAKALTDPVWWFFLTWLPDFFKQTRNLDITHSAAFIASIYAIATVLSIFGGWVVGFLVHRGWSVTRARKTGMFIFACGAIPILLVKEVGNWPAVLLIGLACAAHQAWSANLFTTASDMFPRRAVASVVGLGGMVGSGMNILFPILAGRLLDLFKARHDVVTGYGILFAACGFAYLVAFGVQHLLAPRFEMVDLERA
jgi:ACS family hexuronate transporter-like MFS transporter